MSRQFRVCVVGGINVDIAGTPYSAMIHGDSNPGRVKVSLGGVGRNIAENASLLGMEVTMLTALGDDAYTPWIRSRCSAQGIRLDLARFVPDMKNSLYVSLNGADGDLYAAVSDMEICQAVTPAYLLSAADALREADAVVADANLTAISLRFLAENCRGRLSVDPVSVRKAKRLDGLLDGLQMIKPNLPEAQVLTDSRSADEAAASLCRAGVQRVLITLGASGALYAADGHSGSLPCIPGRIVNTNGCGDAFFAGALRAMLEGASIRDMTRVGLAAASLCAESETSVNHEACWDKVLQRAKIQ